MSENNFVGETNVRISSNNENLLTVEANLIKAGSVCKNIFLTIGAVIGVVGLIVSGMASYDLENAFLVFVVSFLWYGVGSALMIGLAMLSDLVFTAFSNIHFYIRGIYQNTVTKSHTR